MDYLADKFLRPRKIPSTACSGCGLGQCHKALVKAIDDLGYEVNDLVWGTSIGCAGRQTFATAVRVRRSRRSLISFSFAIPKRAAASSTWVDSATSPRFRQDAA